VTIDQNPYPAQVGTWTLTAPDGRTWQGKVPLDCVRQENAERVPAEVRLRRLMEGIHSWGEEAIMLRKDGDYMLVEVEHDKKFIEVIREYCPGDVPISHIVESGGINAKIMEAL
jgi:hypothetical protein